MTERTIKNDSQFRTKFSRFLHVTVKKTPPGPTMESEGQMFDDMIVSELKVELKQRGLPMSGRKEELLQRLKTDSPKKEDFLQRLKASEQNSPFGSPVKEVTLLFSASMNVRLIVRIPKNVSWKIFLELLLVRSIRLSFQA